MNDKALKSLTQLSESEQNQALRARDIMDKNFVTVTESTSIKSAIEILSVKNIPSICVVNNSYIIIGVISEHDLLIQSASQDVQEKIRFTKDVITVSENDPLKTVLLKILKNKLKSIPVESSRGELVGQISRMGLLKILIKR